MSSLLKGSDLEGIRTVCMTYSDTKAGVGGGAGGGVGRGCISRENKSGRHLN